MKTNNSYTNSLLEQLEKKFDHIQNTDDEDTIEEENITGNIEGYNIPGAFGGLPSKDTIEVFDYKQTKKTNKHFKPMKPTSTFKKMASQLHDLNESKYDEIKNDKSVSSKKKVNLAIADVHKKLYEIELIVNRNTKLKTELNQDNRMYWKSTKEKLMKLSERLVRVSNQLKTLGA